MARQLFVLHFWKRDEGSLFHFRIYHMAFHTFCAFKTFPLKMRAISAQKCFELSDPFLKLTEMIIMSFAEPWTTLQQFTDDVLIIKAAALQGV